MQICFRSWGLFVFLCILSPLLGHAQQRSPALRPNILWVTSEDNGPEIGCYGDEYADTPHIDGLAARGLRYTNCWSNAPVCAPARTTIISGMYPTSLGAQHMRSQVNLPEVCRLYPEYFHDLGYYCTNNSKEDYNLFTPKDLWDESSNKAHWRNRKSGQPFFAVFNFTISHESKLRTRPHKAIHSAEDVVVPPYHPDTPEVRQDWAQYYDRITEMDQQVGRVLEQLKEDGLEGDTIVFYYGDHGSGMPRGKRWLYQSGLHVPLVVHVPERFQSLVAEQYTEGGQSDRLVSFVDLMPTVLSLAGTRPPAHLQGNAFLGPYATEPQPYIYGFRDRMDERYDLSRAVRDEQYLYIRNFNPHRPQGAYLDYMFQTPTTQVWKRMFDAGELNEAQSVFWSPKPAEELFDITQDPYQIHNLADSAEHAETLVRMREANRDWMVKIRDVGLIPEGELRERVGEDNAPYDLGHDADRYDVSALYEIADLATRPTDGDISELQKRMVTPDSSSRYWVACGLLIRATQDRQRDEAVKLARGMASDPSPYARSLACETLARFGSKVDRLVALKALLRIAEPSDSGTLAAMTALNSLDWCSPSREEIGNAIGSISDTNSQLSPRYRSYLPNLVKRIESIAD
ncbi:sulfatase-like hydrolase/transferase [Aureliella helgolandensis]|uniref:Sulfatase n=1 Tax=Aureliella helgolandensis TaxID=2527968 RepID=A0A518G3Y3_9BACT|nr:sulfatase-like hydrolase/transferase [Aureliella helgolandensis]QDV23308.1 Sulfatase [Aureliella helgolandensis]